MMEGSIDGRGCFVSTIEPEDCYTQFGVGGEFALIRAEMSWVEAGEVGSGVAPSRRQSVPTSKRMKGSSERGNG